MSRGTNNVTPTSWDWHGRRDYAGAYDPEFNNDRRNYRTEPVSSQVNSDVNRGARDTWRQPVEERGIPGGHLGLPGFGLAGGHLGSLGFPGPPMQIHFLNGMTREFSPAFMGQRNFQVPASAQPYQGSRLTQDEQIKALKKLKKEIYNPVPKKMTSRLSLYYRDRAIDALKEKVAQDKDDDGQRCAVCLEDFEPKESVTLTPCNHMFHEECIVPWIKSHGQCPVCRHALCKRAGGSSSAATANFADFAADVVSDGELISVIRAMEGTFMRGNSTRW